MSPKGLIALLFVGLCATQMASAYRNSREVEKVMDAAEGTLNGMLGSVKDAASASVETVLGYIQKMEAEALAAGNQKLKDLGFPVDLVTIAELFKTNAHSCVANEKVKAQVQEMMSGTASCISKDSDSLKVLINNMQGLWSAAQNMPATMRTIANECAEHGEQDMPENVLDEPVPAPEDHELNPVVEDIMKEAEQTRSKRWIWGLGRITRCVKSVFSLAKADLTNIPGQILSTASNAYSVIKSAGQDHSIPECVKGKITGYLEDLKVLVKEVGMCMKDVDTDAMMAANPKLAGLKSMVEMALTFAKNSGR